MTKTEYWVVETGQGSRLADRTKPFFVTEDLHRAREWFLHHYADTIRSGHDTWQIQKVETTQTTLDIAPWTCFETGILYEEEHWEPVSLDGVRTCLSNGGREGGDNMKDLNEKFDEMTEELNRTLEMLERLLRPAYTPPKREAS